VDLIFAILITSVCLSVVGFVGFGGELLLGNIGRWTRWKELNLRQHLYFWLAMQFVPVVFIILVFMEVTS